MNTDILFSKSPLTNRFRTKSVSDYIDSYLENATSLNIATGYITDESIVMLRRLVEFRKHEMNLSLLIGMNYIEGFTKLQYNAVLDLDKYLKERQLGNVFVCPNVLFHGKMYSFMKDASCLGAFIGSSNLGSFMGTARNYIEADVYFGAELGIQINERIISLTQAIGKPANDADKILDFIEPAGLLDGYEHVKKLSVAECISMCSNASDIRVAIPLKTYQKSHLNTYFGAGKIPGRFSRRDYYEVEIIISKEQKDFDLIPGIDKSKFTVVTKEGYKFECSRQGDYGKNLRSVHDLKILGKWIKGQMVNSGALNLGDRVTDETLEKFGKRNIVLTQSIDKTYWILELQ